MMNEKKVNECLEALWITYCEHFPISPNDKVTKHAFQSGVVSMIDTVFTLSKRWKGTPQELQKLLVMIRKVAAERLDRQRP